MIDLSRVSGFVTTFLRVSRIFCLDHHSAQSYIPPPRAKIRHLVTTLAVDPPI